MLKFLTPKSIELPKSNPKFKTKYLLAIHQFGDETFTLGDLGNTVPAKKYQVLVVLEDIPHYIRHMSEPFWIHPSANADMSE